MKKLLCDDLVFKRVFSNQKILIDFINSYFEYVDSNQRVSCVLCVSQAYILGSKKKSRAAFGDIAGALDNGWLFSLEFYNKFAREQYVKSFSYLTRIYSNQVKKEELWSNSKKVISINLIRGNYHKCNPNIVNIKKFIDTVNPSDMDDDLEMVLIRLDKFTESKYNKEEKESRFIKYLRLFDAKSLEEMEEFAVNDKVFKELVEVIDEFLNDPALDNIRDNHKIEVYQSEKKGREKGIKENQTEVVRNMLQKNYDDDSILEITGIKLYELDELKREMKNTKKRTLTC